MSSNRAKLESLLSIINTAAQEAIAMYEKEGGDVPSFESTDSHPLDDALDTVALKSTIRTLEGACHQLCTTLAPPSHTAINMVQIYDYACIRVVLRENITNILLDYPKGIHVNELGKIINIEPRKLARMMRVLATRGCFVEVDTDTFANNRLSLILHSEHPVRHMVSLHVEACAKGASVFWETLKAPEQGPSYDPAHAPVMFANNRDGITGTFFDWMREDVSHMLQGQRTGTHSPFPGQQAPAYPFPEVSTVVDVGGGIGAFSLPLARTHKNVKITIHDLPEALVQARDIWANECPEAVKEDRVEFKELNFFTQVPVKGKDIYYLRNIIHDWPDDEALLILRNVREALGPNSRVLVHDYVLRGLSRKQAEVEASTLGADIAPEPLLPNYGVGNIRAYEQDMTMWILHNAKERTLQDSVQLAAAANLKLEKVWDLAEACVLEFKAA
ncbi:S-adenosyl-L-methionine-dependent methyltransferase [Coniophora puteana RWD-64-598 SS2]|uniref:S-adenosyl-L-methionine-dependent methyltransferase n=1 Tax=Coniophora puteana (strain RWD-64-598) TaxID=741705 RepID=A0A5M3MNY3_CONPW|nr:S-adenosyl-L-methionine-dependent methyltransferase [Coniophora puteana RWD-64-598 SS2]EIW80747.1 S-adenosyl-L-methionine-dependent methyltransferase [Coniophora puteana RWD-64-598 SS2]